MTDASTLESTSSNYQLQAVTLQRRRTVEQELQQLEARSLHESLPEGFNADEDEDKKETRKLITKTKLYYPIVLNIVHGAVWGVLVRKGLMVLTAYTGAYLSGVVWANFAACLVMGLLVDSSQVWSKLLDVHSDQYPNKGSIPLYTGITTGFCGTCSSFSTVILEAFTKATDTTIGLRYHFPNHAYGIMEFLAVLLGQFGISVTGFHMGKHLAESLDRYVPALSRKHYKAIEYVSMVVGVVAIIVDCVLIGVKHNGTWRSWTFSVLFAPFGALSRFYLSKYLNPKIKNFPLGTFVANLSGTLVLAILNLLSRGKLPGGGQIVTHILGCHVLIGLDDGFCGALTTVSTFVVELFGLKIGHSYRYGVLSIGLSFIVVVLTLGSYNWSVGLTDPVCS